MMLRGMKGISYSWDWVCMSDLVMVGGIFDQSGQKNSHSKFYKFIIKTPTFIIYKNRLVNVLLNINIVFEPKNLSLKYILLTENPLIS